RACLVTYGSWGREGCGQSPASRAEGVRMTEAAHLAVSLRADQLERWRQGERIPVESYLDRHPSLRTDAEALLILLRGELLLRSEQGEVPQLPEYLERF